MSKNRSKYIWEFVEKWYVDSVGVNMYSSINDIGTNEWPCGKTLYCSTTNTTHQDNLQMVQRLKNEILYEVPKEHLGEFSVTLESGRSYYDLKFRSMRTKGEVRAY